MFYRTIQPSMRPEPTAVPSASKPNTTEAPPGQVEALPSRRVVRVFWSLAAINLFVGGMVGLERTVVPLPR